MRDHTIKFTPVIEDGKVIAALFDGVRFTPTPPAPPSRGAVVPDAAWFASKIGFELEDIKPDPIMEAALYVRYHLIEWMNDALAALPTREPVGVTDHHALALTLQEIDEECDIEINTTADVHRRWLHMAHELIAALEPARPGGPSMTVEEITHAISLGLNCSLEAAFNDGMVLLDKAAAEVAAVLRSKGFTVEEI